MSEYVPMTIDVAQAYYLLPGNKDWEAARLAAFYRWLSAHDAELLASQRTEAEVKAEASRLATKRFPKSWIDGTFSYDGNASARLSFELAYIEGAQFALDPATPTPNPDADEAIYRDRPSNAGDYENVTVSRELYEVLCRVYVEHRPVVPKWEQAALAEAWAEGYREGYRDGEAIDAWPTPNPYFTPTTNGDTENE